MVVLFLFYLFYFILFVLDDREVELRNRRDSGDLKQGIIGRETWG